MNPLNILLIGLGNMGKIHERVIENNSETNLYGIVDTPAIQTHMSTAFIRQSLGAPPFC